MAQGNSKSIGLEEENKRLIASLQHSNKLMLDSNEELEKAILIRSEFMAGMSHELRTPLNIIIGFAELMLDEAPGKINEEQRRGLNDILNSGKRLQDTINHILDRFEVKSYKAR